MDGSDKLPLIGRERVLIDALTDALRSGAWAAHHELTVNHDRRRGSSFEVKIFHEGEYTGRIAKITVEWTERRNRDRNLRQPYGAAGRP